MGFFDSLSKIFSLPKSFNSLSDIFGVKPQGAMGGPTPVAAPTMPQLPQILLNMPQPQAAAQMPSMGSNALRAIGQAASAKLANAAGRTSTILTGKKKRRSSEGSGESFDTYSGTTL